MQRYNQADINKETLFREIVIQMGYSQTGANQRCQVRFYENENKDKIDEFVATGCSTWQPKGKKQIKRAPLTKGDLLKICVDPCLKTGREFDTKQQKEQMLNSQLFSNFGASAVSCEGYGNAWCDELGWEDELDDLSFRPSLPTM